MNLNQQLQILINEAPKYGVPSIVMEQGVIPVIKLFALKLKHLEYYIAQNHSGDWLLTTLSKKDQPQEEKKVIYAFANQADADTFLSKSNFKTTITSRQVSQILFQIFALKQVDSIIFMDIPGDLITGVEVHRSQLHSLIEKQLQQLRLKPIKSNNIPPNIA